MPVTSGACTTAGPIVRKLAVSADGKAGAAGRRPLAITGERVRDRVHLLRAQSDAIMIGIGTALADDSTLTCRLPGMAGYSPVRVVLDSALRLPLSSRLARTAREVPAWVVSGTRARPLRCARRLWQPEKDSRYSEAPADKGGASISPRLLKLLAEQGVDPADGRGRSPALAAGFLTTDLVDEAVLFQSPKAVGADGIDAS